LSAPERLEVRCNLAFDLTLSAGDMVLSGDSSDDAVTLAVTQEGFLSHDLAWEGNLVSAIDMDSTQEGEQSLLATEVISLTILGGEGSDTIDASALGFRVMVYGGAGNDTLITGAGDDLLSGDDGDDVLQAGAGADELLGDGDAGVYSTGADTLEGGLGDDTLYGDDPYAGGLAANVLVGGDGQDDLVGGDGDETLRGGDGNDTLEGGAGNDLLEGGEGEDTLYGDGSLVGYSSGNDTLRGDGGNDILHGDDRLGGNGADELDGGSGDDQLWGYEGADLFVGGEGVDAFWDIVVADAVLTDELYTAEGVTSTSHGLERGTLYGTAAANEIDASSFTAGLLELHGGDGNDTLRGGTQENRLYGDAGDDLLLGGLGLDQFFGGTGWDSAFDHVQLASLADASYTADGVVSASHAVELWELIGTEADDVIDASAWTGGGVRLRGQGGHDTLRGGAGADLLVGEAGDDTLEGNLGNDTLYGDTVLDSGSSGNDVLRGGDGDDVLHGDDPAGGSGSDSLSGGAGDDQLFAYGGNDVLAGDAGHDLLDAGDGDDVLDGGTGSDRFLGGAGVDTVADIVSIATLTDEVYTADGATSTWHLVEAWVLTGTEAADTLDASAWTGGALRLQGGAGNDTLRGGSANDTLLGELGDDLLEGNAGNDVLLGDGDAAGYSTGNDVLRGGAGSDTLYGDDRVTGGAGHDLLEGGDGNDSLIGSGGDDTLRGGAGDDLLFGGDGDDQLAGDAGNDILYGDGLQQGFSNGHDTLLGGDGDDVLHGDDTLGGSGNDTLRGEAGSDQLHGYGGNDTLSGGDGSDAFWELVSLEATLTNTSLTVDGWVSSSHSLETATLVGSAADNWIDASLYQLGPVRFYGGAGNDVLKGGSANDLLSGDAGDDDLDGGAGNDQFLGGPGSDFVSDYATIVLLTDTRYTANGAVSENHGVEEWSFVGGGNADTFDASAWTGAGLWMEGRGGNDTLRGGAGNDTLDGGAGNDIIEGNDGDDTLDADDFVNPTGRDILRGGNGNDSLFGYGLDTFEGGAGLDQVSDDGSNVTLTNASYVADGIVSANHAVELWYLEGTGGADTIDASAWTGGELYLWGHAGNDTLRGGAAGDRMEGGDGNDTLEGNGGDDVMDQEDSAGNDTLRGGPGDDRVYGGAGDDLLDAGSGTNRVDGGSGANRLRVSGTAGADVVTVSTLAVVVNGDETEYADLQAIDYYPVGNAGSDTLVKEPGVSVPVLFHDLVPTVQASRSGLVVQGSFTDVGDEQTWTGAIDLGDGQGQRPMALGADKTFQFNLTTLPTANVTVFVTDNEGNVGTATIYETAPLDLRVLSATANGQTTFSVTYQVLSGPAPAFELAVYQSTDALLGSDQLLASLPITSLSDRATGTHTKSWTIGSGSGQVSLPGAGAIETDDDYSLLVVADPSDFVPEDDPAGTGEDNVATFVGNYFAGQGLVMVHGGPAADTIVIGGSLSVSVNGVAATYVASRVTGVRVRTHAGNDSVNASASNRPLGMWGGDGNDTLTGGTVADLLAGNAGNDALSGGNGNDTFQFDTDAALGSDTLADSGGVDRLDFSLTTTRSVAVSLGVAAAQVVNSHLTLTLGSTSAFDAVTGGSQGDTLTGNDGANALNGGGGNDQLAGGKGVDTFVFDLDEPQGLDTLTELNGGGADVLDFTATTGQSAMLDLGKSGVQVVHANLQLTLASPGFFENAVGGTLGDTLIGNSAVNRLWGGAGDDVLRGLDGNDVLEGESGNDTLVGGNGDDTYGFDADLGLGVDAVQELTGGGMDTLDFTLTTTRSIQVDLSASAAQVVNAGLNLVLGDGGVLENVVGGALADVLIGNSLANRLTGLAGNDVLRGGSGDDVYLFDADLASGTDTLVEADGEGVDTLDFSATRSKKLAVNLGLAGSQATVPGTSLHTLVLGNGEVFENVVGGVLDDTLLGNGRDNRLVGGAGADTLRGYGGADTISGDAGNDVLDGGDDNDRYVFLANAALGSDVLVEAEAGGVDLLDFSTTTAAAVVVDLARATAQVVNGYLTLNLGGPALFEMVVGSAKNDTLLGNALDNVLLGGGGADVLNGGSGRDVLVGGSLADTMHGGDGEDLLVSGLLTYFAETTKQLDVPALLRIRAEWTRLDADYATRIQNLRVGGGLNETARVNSQTVLTDGTAVDSLFGQADLDWFWKFGNDSVGDKDTGGPETLN
jgi:Ca2+-binding RTX toxin-like protein